jgi:hypothetical protein
MEPRRRRAGAWFALILASTVIFVRVAVATASAALGFLALLGFAAFLLGLVMWTRRRADQQIESSIATGQLRIELGLDFTCLPGDWPTRARETLNAAGAGRTPSLPVVLTSEFGKLIVEKRRSFLLGRSALHAEIPTAAITGVRVGPSRVGIAGLSIAIQLRSGEELRGDLPVSAERAEVVAQRIRALMGGTDTSPGPTAIEITSPPPPLRTPPGRAGVLMMAPLAPFMIAMAGAHEGHVDQDRCRACNHRGRVHDRRRRDRAVASTDRSTRRSGIGVVADQLVESRQRHLTPPSPPATR